MGDSAKTAQATVIRRKVKPLPVRVDGLSNCALLSLFGVFFGLLMLFIIGSAFAPPLLLNTELAKQGVYTCSDPACDRVNVVRTITGLSPMNQFLQISMAFEKPQEDGGTSSFQSLAADFDVLVDVATTGRKTATSPPEPVGPSQSHVRHVTCREHEVTCSPFVVLTEGFLFYSSYTVNVTLHSPFTAFGESGAILTPKLVYNMTALAVNSSATQAEVGIRFFCFTLSLLFFIIFLVSLCRLPKQRKWSLEQRWAIALLAGVSVFSNPFVLAAVYTPGPGWSALNTFFTVSFVCSLLLFWLVYTHVAVLAGANRVSSSSNIELRAGFLLPKALYVVFFYAVMLMGSFYLIYKLEEDPAFSLWDETTPGYRSLAVGIGTALAVIYTLWLLVYLGLALWYQIQGRLARQFAFFLAMTLTAFVAVVAAYFAGAVAPVPRDTVTTFAFFMAPNLYVWTFAFANVPGVGHISGGGGFSDAESAEKAVVSGAAAAADPESSGVLSDTLAEDDAERLELELAEEGAMRSGTRRQGAQGGRRDDNGRGVGGSGGGNDDDDDDAVFAIGGDDDEQDDEVGVDDVAIKDKP